ncbi:hypothetical protein AB1284_25340 [Bacillus sp. S2(2024)]|uniref:hypothetical protein n=1 Tax=Bacillus sp. S2(2024) TaxID=3162887 RepID=UPI003D2290BE
MQNKRKQNLIKERIRKEKERRERLLAEEERYYGAHEEEASEETTNELEKIKIEEQSNSTSENMTTNPALEWITTIQQQSSIKKENAEEAEARKRTEEEARRHREEERQVEEARRRREEEERQAEEVRRREEAEARKRAEEEARRREEAEARKRAEEEARRREEAEARKRAEEEARRREEAEARKRAEEEARRREEAEARKRAEEEARKREEAEVRKRLEEEARRRREEEERQVEEARRRREEEERQVEEARRCKEVEARKRAEKERHKESEKRQFRSQLRKSKSKFENMDLEQNENPANDPKRILKNFKKYKYIVIGVASIFVIVVAGLVFTSLKNSKAATTTGANIVELNTNLVNGLRLSAVQKYQDAALEFDKVDYKKIGKEDKKAVLFTYLLSGKAQKAIDLEEDFAESIVSYYLAIDNLKKVKELKTKNPLINFEIAALDEKHEEIIKLKDKITLDGRREGIIVNSYLKLNKAEEAKKFAQKVGNKDLLEKINEKTSNNSAASVAAKNAS